MIFREYKINNNIMYTWQVNKLILSLKKLNNDWFIHTEYNNLEFDDIYFIEDDTISIEKWTRIISTKDTSRLRISPLMPDRPVVIKLKETLRIPEKQKFNFLTKIPLGLKLSLISDNSEQFLCEFPSELLSNTWFGDIYTGILSYSIESGVYNNLSELNLKEYFVISPVQVNNKTKNYFDFKKFSLYANYLNIYKGPKALWNNETIINCIDENKINIQVTDKKPFYEQELTFLTKPRTNYDKNILSKSINVFIKSIYGE